jgi:O-antigen/teichoic acid export membrane protein
MLLLSSIFIVYLARLLGPSNYGKYVFASNFPMIFFVALNFLHELSVRDIARDKHRASDYLSNNLSLKIFIFPLLFLIIYFFMRLMRYPQDTTIAVYILSLYFFLQQMSTSVAAIFNANEKLGYFAISAVAERFIIVSLALVILFYGGSLTTFVWAFVVGGFIRFVILSSLVKRYAQIKFTIDLRLYKYFFKAGYPILVSSFVVILLSKIGIIFLSKMKGDEAVGLYGLGYGLYITVSIIAASLSGAVFPVFSKYSQSNTDTSNFIYLYKVSFKFLFATAILLTVGVLVLAERAILLFFKDEYIASANVLRIIFLALPLFFVRNLLLTILFSINKQKQSMICLGIGLLLSLILCAILIPRYSYIGASISFVISEIIIFAMLFYLVSRYFFKLNILDIILKSFICGFITYIFLYYFKQFNLFLIIISGASVFMGLLFFVGLFTKEHIKAIQDKIFLES